MRIKLVFVFGFCLPAWSSIYISNGQQWISALWPWSRWHTYRAGGLCDVISKSRAWNLPCSSLWDEQINGNTSMKFISASWFGSKITVYYTLCIQNALIWLCSLSLHISTQLLHLLSYTDLLLHGLCVIGQ